MGRFGPEAEIWPGGTRYGLGTEGYVGDRQMANKLTRQMMSALQNCRVCTEFLLGPREKVDRVITERLVEGGKQFGCVLRG
jgi:hypothetical protein